MAGQSIPTGVRRVDGRDSLDRRTSTGRTTGWTPTSRSWTPGSAARTHGGTRTSTSRAASAAPRRVPDELGRRQRPRHARRRHRRRARQRHRRGRRRAGRAPVGGPDPRLGGQRADRRGTSAASTGSPPSATRSTRPGRCSRPSTCRSRRRAPTTRQLRPDQQRPDPPGRSAGSSPRASRWSPPPATTASTPRTSSRPATTRSSRSRRSPTRTASPAASAAALCYSWGTYDRDDTFADFSNYGGDVDLIAPGKCIWSTLPGNRYGYVVGDVDGRPARDRRGRAVQGVAPARDARRRSARRSVQPGPSTGTPGRTRTRSTSRCWTSRTSSPSATSRWTPRPGPRASALVGAAGASLALPVSLIRAEDFPSAVHLAASVEGTAHGDPRPPQRWPDRTRWPPRCGVAVPAGTPSGTYTVTVTADDGTPPARLHVPRGRGQRPPERDGPGPRAALRVQPGRRPERRSGRGPRRRTRRARSPATRSAGSSTAPSAAPTTLVRGGAPDGPQDEARPHLRPAPARAGRRRQLEPMGGEPRPSLRSCPRTPARRSPGRAAGRATTGRGCPAARRSTRAPGAPCDHALVHGARDRAGRLEEPRARQGEGLHRRRAGDDGRLPPIVCSRTARSCSPAPGRRPGRTPSRSSCSGRPAGRGWTSTRSSSSRRRHARRDAAPRDPLPSSGRVTVPVRPGGLGTRPNPGAAS